MTQRSSNHLGQECAGKVVSELSATAPTVRAEELGELLDRVRHHAVLFLSQVPSPPRTLRVRAGEVVVDAEWVSERGVTALGATEPAAKADPEADYLTSPGVGVFYRAPEPGTAPFVSVGDSILPGQQVGIIEAMKLMIPVESDKAGQVAEVLKNNGEPVEYGERLFALAAVDGA
jgi:acetyl-CoA carboxylase biotin carboxyl carrier protein